MRSKDLDAKLGERALRHGWDVPEALKGPLIARLNELAMSTDPAIGAREKISAAKALLLADKLGLESIRTAIVADNHDGVVERLQAIERQLDAKDEDLS
jgi:hypothetical protein